MEIRGRLRRVPAGGRPGERDGGPGKAFVTGDFRRVLERKDVDAVVIATPDHWHALIAVAACEAGKDVYVEKPISHNVREGRLMVEAARRRNRVAQVGIQQRSGAHFQRAVKAVQEGRIGGCCSRSAGTTTIRRTRRGWGSRRTARRRRISIGTCGWGPPRGSVQPGAAEFPRVLGLCRRRADELVRPPARTLSTGRSAWTRR